ncbi:dermonecrotic toxin domain-containing protein [Pseudomonas sp. Eth.TT006]
MTTRENHSLPNAGDKAALRAIATRIIQTCPSLQDCAHQVASDLLIKQGITGHDPDHIYFHRFEAAQSSSKSFTGWEHVHATPTSSMTLTQLVIQRFRTNDQDNADLLDVYAGFYSVGPETRTFNETNEIRLHGNDVLKSFWSTDFSALYDQTLTAFWRDSGGDFRTLAKCNFLLSAVQARDKRQLSDEDFRFVTEATIGPITWPVSLASLQTEHTGSDRLRVLDIAGYRANNILRFIAPMGRHILYLPGEADAFQVLETATDLHYWVLQRMNKEDARQAFMTHFSLADRQTITAGITDLMNRLVKTWGQYDHHLINQTDRLIDGDAFTWLRGSTKSAMFAEAELSLTANGDIRKKLWIGYLSAGVRLLAPMAVVGWPVALPVIGASIASMGLNIDQAVNGKTAGERKAGILGAVLAGIDVLFNLAVLKGPGSLQEIGPEVELAEASEMADLKQSAASASRAKPSASPTGTVLEPSINQPAKAAVPESFKIDLVLKDSWLNNAPGKFKGIYQLESNPSSAIKLNGDAYYVRYESDINGHGRWVIIDPANPHAYSGTIPVRLNVAGRWEVAPRLGLRGGMLASSSSTAGKPVVEEWTRRPGLHTAGIEDAEMRAWALGGPDRRAQYRRIVTIGSVDVRSVLTSDVHPPEPLRIGSVALPPELTEELSEFDLAQEDDRDQLVAYARAYYRLNPPLPRVAAPVTSPIETTADLLDNVFAEKTGLVIGENSGAVGSKQFLIENMQGLAQRGVKTLYLQKLLANVNQLDLDAFARTGEMPQELEDYLKRLDFIGGNDPEGRFNLLNLVKAANARQIRVQAIDMSTTFNVGKDADWEADYRMARSFFASEIIVANEQMKGPAPWVALVDHENMATFRDYQGISEQTGAASLRIEDVPPGQTQKIDADPGLLMEYVDAPHSPAHEPWPEGNIGEVRSLIQGDWRLQSDTVWANRSPQDLHALLSEPCMFTFQRYRNNVLVVYRNAQGHMADSVLRPTPEGRINLEIPMRPDHDTLTVDNLDELREALIERGMTPKGWPPVATTLDTLASDLTSALPDAGQAVIPQNWQANELLDALTPEATPGKFQGIYRLEANPSTAIMLNDCAYYVRYEPDPNGGGTWAIIDPEQPNAFSGAMPVRLNERGEWELTPRGGLKGGGNIHPGRSRNQASGPSRTSAQPLPQQARTLPSVPTTPASRPGHTPVQYDTPYRPSLRRVAFGRREYLIKMVRQPDGNMQGTTAFDEYVAARRTNLLKDARQFFSEEDLSRLLPERPDLTRVRDSKSSQQLIQTVFEAAPGLVIGESQDRIASMHFLIENMPTFAAQKVKTLYFHRLLNDFNQVDLDQFFRTGEMPGDLEFYLQRMQSDPAAHFTPLEVIRAAQRNGIRVQATDCMASYRFPGSPMPDMHEQAVKTYLTHTIMKADQALNGAGKWLVLTDQENTNTFRGMPGISEMQGGVGLRIEEVLPEQQLVIETDRGITVGRGFSTQVETTTENFNTLFADMSLEVPTPLSSRTPAELEQMLFRQGMYTFEKTEDQWTLIHRGRDGQIARTPVDRTFGGEYMINRPAWTEVHRVPYASILDLSWALSRMGMKMEGRMPV